MVVRRTARGVPSRKAAPVALPDPSVTLDVSYPLVGGNVIQMRPTFKSFKEAIASLQEYEKSWAKTLAGHKKAARSK